jgi:eukaryotic-like serine/threonine-protein kinase
MKSFGRYTLQEKIGEGGMAVVYKADDDRLKTIVAIKIIRTEKLSAEKLQSALGRFEREARILASLTHPNIVSIIDYGSHEGIPYLVMPYLPGGTLKDKLGKPVGWKRAIQTLLPIACGLEYAHNRGVVHRDIKSSNIIMTESGQPMLSDFGVAKSLTSKENTELTITGVGIGTPMYMAPEQWKGHTSPQSDQYSLGVVFYEMLTGRRPYVAETPAAILIKQSTEPLPHPREYGIDLPKNVAETLIKCLSLAPEDRLKDMGELVARLEHSAKINKPISFSQKLGGVLGRKKNIQAYNKAAKPSIYYLGLGLMVFGLFLVSKFLLDTLGQTGNDMPSITSTKEMAPTQLAEPSPTWAISNATPTESVTASVFEYNTGSTLIDKDGMTLVFVQQGEFNMGNSDGEGDEQPVRTVFLNSYWIDKTEVTNIMYKQCVSAGACVPPTNFSSSTRSSYYNDPAFNEYPVIYVTWDMANSYCIWVERKLPTEAEWEKAARGTDERQYPWGDIEPNSNLMNLYIGDTTTVGSYPEGQSPHGALDMAGNVWEWVNDWYDASYYGSSPTDNPKGPPSGTSKVLRGGSWYYGQSNVRTTFRNSLDPSYSSFYYGFRCAKSID